MRGIPYILCKMDLVLSLMRNLYEKYELEFEEEKGEGVFDP